MLHEDEAAVGTQEQLTGVGIFVSVEMSRSKWVSARVYLSIASRFSPKSLRRRLGVDHH